MTTHIDDRATDDRPATGSGTTTGATASTRRRLPWWVAVVGVVAAVCVAGIGVLVRDATSEPPPALIEDSAIGDGHLLRPGMPDGFWQPEVSAPPANAMVREPPAVRTGQLPPPGGDGHLLRPGMPDGYWRPIAPETGAPRTTGTGEVPQPGRPDGHFVAEPTEVA